MRETNPMIAQLFRAVMIGLSVLWLVCCDKVEPRSKPASVRITGAGATFPEPLYKKWIDQFASNHPGVMISYEGVGSGEGIKKFLRQEVDFGASDAAMTDEEIAKVDRGVKLIPATAGIVVLAYRLDNLNGELRLPRQVYTDIFLGKIKSWSDPHIKEANPGLDFPSREIVTVARQDSSGTTFAFTNHLATVSHEWKSRGPGVGKLVAWPTNPMLGRGNEGVAAKIRIGNGTIGYMEYGYAQRGGLAMALLENEAGRFVKPEPERGRDTLAITESSMTDNLRLFIPDPPGENSYPIVTYSWILLYGKYPDAQKTQAIREFVKWGITEGQQLSPGLGYCPLPAGVVDRAQKALGLIH